MDVLDCRVIFHDPSHLVLKKTQNGFIFRTGQYQQLFLSFDKSNIKFYPDKQSKEEICSISSSRLNIEHDKNAKLLSVLSLFHGGDEHPTLEIRSDANTLETISQNVVKMAKFNYKSPLCYTPANRNRETVFTSGDVNINLRGFLNLALLALLFAKFRDILKNFMEYGMVITSTIEVSITFPELVCYCASSLIPILFLWWVHKRGLQKKFSDRFVDACGTITTITLIVLPIFVCKIFAPNPISGICYITVIIGNIMKLYSYTDVMSHLRKTVPRIIQLEKDKKDIIAELGEHNISKENLEIILNNKDDISRLANIKDLLYFLTVPTFCYQLWYPRNPKIRLGFLAKRIGENFICWALFAFVLNQYIMPLMDESVEILEKGNFVEILERVIRLSFPVQVCWILFFFGVFQFTFNILAEIQRFSDRQFYKDWWNCRDLNEYWRLWNLPIHEFFTRHVYYPMLRKGYSKEFAKLAVFFFSAVGHEYWASVPLRIIAFWAFFLMLVQLPIMLLELKLDKLLKGSQLGNIFFWISFCFVGQPMALLLYYQLYIRKHGG